MTDAEAAEAFACLVAAYPGATVHPDSSRVYRSMLRDLDASVVGVAIGRIIATHEYPTLPTPAMIRKECAAVEHGSRRARSGLEAWETVNEAVQRLGAHRNRPAFDDPITERVLRAFRWRELCLANDVERTSLRARFIDAYEAAADAAFHERQIPAALRVGDDERPRLEAAKPIAALLPAITKGKK